MGNEDSTNQGLLSQESWAKKIKQTKVSNFTGNELKKTLCFRNLEESLRFENVFCIHCRRYNDDKEEGPVAWLGCDKCSNWMHRMCAVKLGLSSYDDVFLCSKCSRVPSHTDDSPPTAIDFSECTEYEHFINKNYNKISTELENIEMRTRGQRENAEWIKERKMRITASMFGAIFKGRTDKRLSIIAKDIVSPRSLEKIPSIRHGIKNEENALKMYESLTKTKCYLSGLQVHKTDQFIAGSPDALIGSEGILEIKCPFLIRNENPIEAIKLGKLPYFHKDGSLRINSNYYFQVQGLLEITDRKWCDIFIYSNRGYFMQRIERKRMFWNNIFPKLKYFFLFFIIPYLVRQTTPEKPVKWTTVKNIEFLENGLVNDYKYYMADIPKMIYIGFYPDAKCPIKEITNEDLSTLSGSEWLSNFVVDICFNLFEKKNINLISCNVATLIFYDGIIR